MTTTRSEVLDFTPWPHQVPSMQARANGARWVCKVWHRRAGKDLSDFVSNLKEAYDKPGIYYHCFPELTQGRKALWDGRDNDGVRYIDYVPGGMLASKPNETEMQLELRTRDPKKTSLYQVVGADRLGWIGSNPRHVVMSEYQDQDPQAWQLLSPILMANRGGASFCFTPRGHNHAYELYRVVKDQPSWHTELLTVLDTRKPDGTRIVTEEDLEIERTIFLKPEALIQQEYFCSFEGNLVGAVYGDLLKRAREDTRVTLFDYTPGIDVVPAFDIGHGDATACGWWQAVGETHRLIRYEEQTGTTVDYWAERLKAVRVEHKYGYRYVNGDIYCVGPHDLRHVHWAGPNSAEAAARKVGLYFHVVEKLGIAEGLQAGRQLFPRLWLHERDAARFVEVAGAYKYEWDKVSLQFSTVPVHDWTSHGADMYRYYATAVRETPRYTPALKAKTGFDVYSDAETEFNPYATEGR